MPSKTRLWQLVVSARNLFAVARLKRSRLKVFGLAGAIMLVATTISGWFEPGFAYAASPSPPAPPRASADPDQPRDPLRPPPQPATAEQLEQTQERRLAAPVARLTERLSVPGSYSLLPYIQYTPAERQEGWPDNDWVWAGTGVMEIALNVQKGVKERLSIQYFDSNYPPAQPDDWAGAGGDPSDFAGFYGNPATAKAVPWRNTNADYRDAGRSSWAGPLVDPATIQTTPSYPIGAITAARIPTTGVDQATAIANIKNVLNQKKAVWFASWLPSRDDWYQFVDFWTFEPETSVWLPSSASGQAVQQVSSRNAVCVGYNDEDPVNPYWIMLNSWGTTDKRPNGLFRVAMNMDYSASVMVEGSPFSLFEFQTLDVDFPFAPAFSVATDPSKNIGTTTAGVSGQLLSLAGAASAAVSFEYGPTASYGSSTPARTMTANGMFTDTITGLVPGTTYHFRAKAAPAGGAPVYGNDRVVTTHTPQVAGQRLLFTSRKSGNDDIYTMNPDGTDVRQLTNSPSNERDPSWSPDGTRIVFWSMPSFLGPLRPASHIYVMNADGSNIRRITDAGDENYMPSWSPDGSRIVFLSNREGRLADLYTVSPDGSNLVRLTYTGNSGDYIREPAWSPDGARIAFQREGQIWIMNADGGGQVRLTSEEEEYGRPMWSPDGTRIAFWSERDERPAIWTMNTSGGNLARVTPYDISVYGASWSPDGTRMVLLAQLSYAFDIYTFFLDGTGLTRITDSPWDEDSPSWSPVMKVDTGYASNVTATGAVLQGNQLSLGAGGPANVSFQWGTAPGVYTGETPAQAKNAAGPFTAALTGLTTWTTYYYRAKAVGGATVYGAEMKFTAGWSPPWVVTSPATQVNGTSATLNGNLIMRGWSPNVNVWFEYGARAGYGMATAPQLKTTTGAFSAAVTGLVPGVTYHYRARADAGQYGGLAGADMVFTTKGAARVETAPVTAVTATSATLVGEIKGLGSAAYAEVLFEYGPTASYGSVTPVQRVNGLSRFTAAATGLTAWSKNSYHFRAKAVIGGVTYYGGDVSFYVQNEVKTLPASNITGTSATLNGNLTQMVSAEVWVSFLWAEFDGPLPHTSPDELFASASPGPTPAQRMTARGAFNANISGLTGKLVLFQALADDHAGHVARGNIEVIGTLPDPFPDWLPTVRTAAATSVGSDSAVLNSNVVSFGEGDFGWVSFEYGPTASYGSLTEYRLARTTGPKTIGLGGLSPGTTYHYRARIDDGEFVAFGADMTFTTTTAPATTVEVNSGAGIAIPTGGSRTDIPVDIKHLPFLGADNGLGALSLDLAWNKNIVRVDSVRGAAIPGWTILAGAPDNSSGRASLVGFNSGPFSTADTRIATLSITAVGAAANSSVLGVTIKSLGDKNGAPMAATPVNATVVIGAVAETGLGQKLDTDGVAVLEVKINKIKDPVSGATVTIPGGVGSFSATETASTSGGIAFAPIRQSPPYLGVTFDQATGVFGVASVASPQQPNNSTVAKLVPYLTGDVFTSYTLSVSFQSITAASGGMNVPEQAPQSLTFRRGDADGNGVVNIFDAMYMVQYLVGSRPIGDLSAVNAASVKHDGPAGDVLDVFDAMYLAQWVVGNRNARFEPI